MSNVAVTVFKDTIGKVFSLTLNESNGTPIDLTSSTVTATVSRIGDDTTLFTSVCSITDATNGLANFTSVSGDLDTTGQFYTTLAIVYVGGDSRTEVGPNINIVEDMENVVPVADFIDFIDVPESTAKPESSIKKYLEQAEVIVDLHVSSIASTTTDGYVRQKKTLIMLKAAVFYFGNMDEGNVDPNKRNPKVELWERQYKAAMDALMESLSGSAASPGISRRVKNSAYDDPNSYLYGTDE